MFDNFASLIQSAAMGCIGEPIQYLRNSGEVDILTGIYSSPTVESSQGQVLTDFTPGPRIELRKGDLDLLGIVPAEGDRIRRQNKTYALGEARDDGYGGLTILLEEVTP